MILLDTNIVVPLFREQPEILPAQIVDFLEKSEPPFRVSAVSLWEMAIKNRAGKLPIVHDEEEWPDICELFGMRLLPFLPSHAVRSVSPWPDTKDPFDRALLSVCSVEGLKLVTTDRKLADHPLAWRA